jgi:hypothetical protein
VKLQLPDGPSWDPAAGLPDLVVDPDPPRKMKPWERGAERCPGLGRYKCGRVAASDGLCSACLAALGYRG